MTKKIRHFRYLVRFKQDPGSGAKLSRSAKLIKSNSIFLKTGKQNFSAFIREVFQLLKNVYGLLCISVGHAKGYKFSLALVNLKKKGIFLLIYTIIYIPGIRWCWVQRWP